MGTTDLDAGATVIWDMTAIAACDTPQARALFRQVLLASSTLPGFMPPVMIRVDTTHGPREEMHVDGALQEFFIGPAVEAASRANCPGSACTCS